MFIVIAHATAQESSWRHTLTPSLDRGHNIPAQTSPNYILRLRPASSALGGTFATRKISGWRAPPRSIHAPVRRRRVVRELQLAVLLYRREDVGHRERRGVLQLQLGQVLLQQGRLGREAHRQLGGAQLRQRLRRTRRVAAALRGHPTDHSTPLDGSASSGSRGESGDGARGREAPGPPRAAAPYGALEAPRLAGAPPPPLRGAAGAVCRARQRRSVGAPPNCRSILYPRGVAYLLMYEPS